MRVVVLGAGGVGGTLGGRLAQAGHAVTLVARGAHAAALAADGLRLRSPDADEVIRLPVVTSPAAIAFAGDEVVLVAVKSQDTAPALAALAAAAPPSVIVACAQNGVANERAALRRFAHVLGVCVDLPAAHLAPGIVEIAAAPVAGLAEVGRYPDGDAAAATELAGALAGAGFAARAVSAVMRWKYRKLLVNLGNAVDAACGPRRAEPAGAELIRRLRDEGAAVLDAAGIDRATDAEAAVRPGAPIAARPIAGAHRPGGSSWQSLARGAGTIEADYLNGEIVLIARQHGLTAPQNAAMQRVANQLARAGRPPGSVAPDDLLATVLSSPA